MWLEHTRKGVYVKNCAGVENIKGGRIWGMWGYKLRQLLDYSLSFMRYSINMISWLQDKLIFWILFLFRLPRVSQNNLLGESFKSVYRMSAE